MEWSAISDIVVSLITLTFLEVVLGVDNLIFISIAVNRLPLSQQKAARRTGLMLALVTRLIFLSLVVWLVSLTQTLFTVWGNAISWRDIFLVLGGLFLLYKGTFEIHTELEGEEEGNTIKKMVSFTWVVIQIAVLDIIFSIDSVFTAVGMTQKFWVMATAITIAIVLMTFASEPLSEFVARKPTIKMLALSFILLIGTVLIADGFNFHIPRAYIYFALSFSVMVEILNSLVAQKRRKHKNF